jgi:hypothetical protein
MNVNPEAHFAVGSAVFSVQSFLNYIDLQMADLLQYLRTARQADF